MAERILIVGGSGRIGRSVAQDLHAHTAAQLVIAGRSPASGEAVAREFGARGDFVQIDLDSAGYADLCRLVRPFDLVVLCTGPFRRRPPTLLEACIASSVNYVDVCDDREATLLRLALDEAAGAAGITALIDTGTFPGIDNVMVADALARHPEASDVRLYFVCAGSGGGGFGVLQTTFLAVSRPYWVKRGGRWVTQPAYGERQVVDFGEGLGQRPVYGFEVPELWSLPRTFPQLRTCSAKFGTVPELWNWATWALARAPQELRVDTQFLDRSAAFALPLVHRLDRRVGEALGIRVEVRDKTELVEVALFYAESTTRAVGWATGEAAAMVLGGEISEPGVLLPESHIPPRPYLSRLRERGGRLTRMARGAE